MSLTVSFEESKVGKWDYDVILRRNYVTVLKSRHLGTAIFDFSISLKLQKTVQID